MVSQLRKAGPRVWATPLVGHWETEKAPQLALPVLVEPKVFGAC